MMDPNTLILDQLRQKKPLCWCNDHYNPAASLPEFYEAQAAQAAANWQRYQAFLQQLFAAELQAPFASPLIELGPELWLKADHQLPLTGSVKARGGLYELLYHAEQLATAEGLLTSEEKLDQLLRPEAKSLFASHRVLVGSTGNLGMSIGKIARQLGFSVEVHMSRDAKTWKKSLLRSLGAEVVEHIGDYGEAVAVARALAAADSQAYFVDDEQSLPLLLGYSQAASELASQFAAQGYQPSVTQPLIVLIPCGVGGAPAGISLGLKALWGNGVHCVFVEPTGAPSVLLGLLKGEPTDISEIGLDGLTQADGLAVAKASPLAVAAMTEHLMGVITVTDESMLLAMQRLFSEYQLRVEPSAAAGLAGLELLQQSGIELAENSRYLLWTTGGGLLPNEEFAAYLQQASKL